MAALVSVLTPFLNPGRFLEEAIESVRAQSYSAWELLLINDGSTDASGRAAQEYARREPERIRYLEHVNGEHLGVSASRNLGLHHASGRYVTFLDADDVYVPEKLAQQVAIIESQPLVSLVYGNTQYWNSWLPGGGEVSAPDFVPDLGVPFDTVLDPPSLLTLLYPLGTVTAPSLNTVIVHRTVAARLGGFEDAFTLAYSDQSLLVKFYLSERVYVSNYCWDRYRQHSASSSAIVEKTGQYRSIRHRFLRWFGGYLRVRHVTDPVIRDAIDRALAEP